MPLQVIGMLDCEAEDVLDAVAEPPGEIRTGDRVEVVDVIDGRTLVVRKLQAPNAGGHFWDPPLKS
jgi:membrane-bound ClpP family serine protease